MPRPKKDARLVLERRRGRDPQWLIRDGETRIRTGCGEDDRRGADEALAQYLRSRWVRPAGGAGRALLLRDVLALYGKEHAPSRQDPARIGWAIKALLPFWGDKHATDVSRSVCARYAKDRQVAEGTIRRELGVLSAALRYAEAEGVIDKAPRVSLPPPPPPRDKWLTRADAARLAWACRSSKRRHLGRLFAICLYTGTRPGAALRLAWSPHRAGGWIDVDRGLLHRVSADAVLSNKRQPPCPMPRQLVVLCRIWRDADARAAQAAQREDQLRGRAISRSGRTDRGVLGRHERRADLLSPSSADRAPSGAGLPSRRGRGGDGLERAPVIHFRGQFVASVKTAFAALRRETGIEVTPHTLHHPDAEAAGVAAQDMERYR